MNSKRSSKAPQQELADPQLVQQAYAGDTSAFTLLVNRYQRILYPFVCSYVGKDDADDVLQFVWIQCYRHLSDLQRDQFKGWRGTEVTLKSWLFRVALNRCVDELRKRQRQCERLFSELEVLFDDEGASQLLSILDTDPLPEERVERQDIQQTLREAIWELPKLPRTIVWLRYTEDLSFSEIASRLHITTNTAKTYYYRACTKLRHTLSPSREEVSLSLCG